VNVPQKLAPVTALHRTWKRGRGDGSQRP